MKVGGTAVLIMHHYIVLALPCFAVGGGRWAIPFRDGWRQIHCPQNHEVKTIRNMKQMPHTAG